MLGAIAAWQQNASVAALTNSLRIDGQEHAPRVAPESIKLREEGPGGVSSLSFVIDDQAKAYTVTEGQTVVMWDVTRNRPRFYGWVRKWKPVRHGLGRQIHVAAVGAEALLDWQKLPALTIPAGTDLTAAIQALAHQSTGVGVALRALSDGSNQGSQAGPIGDITGSGVSTDTAVAIPAGTSLREGLQLLLQQLSFIAPPTVPGVLARIPRVTVDFYLGLRFWDSASGAPAPSDYDTLLVKNVAAPVGTETPAANLEHGSDAGQVVHQVYVVGGNAAGTGLVSDGSGKIGDVATLSDSTILTATDRDRAGIAYMASRGVIDRGSFVLEDVAPATIAAKNMRAGGQIVITDNEIGVLAQYMIAAIEFSFVGNQESWAMEYGAMRPSAIRAMRRLTRSVLS